MNQQQVWCSKHASGNGDRTESANFFLLVCFPACFFNKRSCGVYVCLCKCGHTKLRKAYSSSIHGRKCKRIKKSNQCQFIVIEKVHVTENISPQALQRILCNLVIWKNCFTKDYLERDCMVWEHTVYRHTYSLNYTTTGLISELFNFLSKRFSYLFFKVRRSIDRWKT